MRSFDVNERKKKVSSIQTRARPLRFCWHSMTNLHWKAVLAGAQAPANLFKLNEVLQARGKVALCPLVSGLCLRLTIHSVLRNRTAGVAVTLWTRIREILGPNLARNPGYPDWDFSFFSSVPPDKCRDSIWIRPRLLPSKYFPVHHSYIILPYSVAIVGVANIPLP
jgi:hypothetical protein